MDGWRSTNHWKGSWMVRRHPKKLGVRWGALCCVAFFCDFFLEGDFLSFFFGFWCDLGRFWEAQVGLKIELFNVFCDVFSVCVLEMIFK